MGMDSCEGVITGKNAASRTPMWQVKVEKSTTTRIGKVIDVYAPGIELRQGMKVSFKVVSNDGRLKAIGVKEIRGIKHGT